MSQTNKTDQADARSIKVVGRLSFPVFFKPEKDDQGNDRYGGTLLLPPNFNTKILLPPLIAAAEDGWGKDRAKWPKGPTVRLPETVVRDANEKSHLAGYEPGWHFISFSAKNRPGVVDAMIERVTDPAEAYPGRWAKVSLRAFTYKNKTVGVAFGLNNVQLLRHDEKFGGAPRAEDEFEQAAEEMEDTPF
jgi:hypothetical protein